ncbi:MAG: T9SS type A sorting domain-containing protein [candidate division WOR-3 bacterium]
MVRYFLMLLIFGLASAELNVGDKVRVPLNLFSLTFTKDYIEASDSGLARVILKNEYAYVLTMDTVDIPLVGRTYIIPPDTSLKTAHIIDTIIKEVVPAVQSFFGNINYLDSDNDPRIFIVLAGIFVSDGIKLVSTGDIVGYFDPYYSKRTNYERHEFFILNCASLLTNNNCSRVPNKISLRKTLYYLYTQYALYSIKGDLEDPFALSQASFYLASKIDTFSTDTFAYGFQNKSNIVYVLNDELNAAVKYYFAPNFIKPYVSQVALSYTLDDVSAQNTYFFFLNLEEKYGFNNLKQMILNTSKKFYEQFHPDTLKALIINTHLKNLLNSKGFGYDYQNYNKEIYPWTGTNSIYNALRPDVRWFTQPVLSSIGFVARSPAVVGKPFIFNWTDSSNIKVFKIDTIDKTISELPYNVYRLLISDSLKRNRERLFFINLDNKNVNIIYYNGDTIGPTYDTFFVNWNRFSLNTFEIYLKSKNSIALDVAKFNKILLKVETPSPNYSPIIEMNLKELIDTNYYYYAKIIVPKLESGTYKFSVFDARDSFDNFMVNKPSYSVIVNYLNPQTLSIFYDGEIMIKNLDNKVNLVLISKLGNSYNVNSSSDFPAYIYIKSSKPENVIYYNNKPVETYYDNGYVYALYQGDGFYTLSSGKPIVNFKYYLKGNLLFINSPVTSPISIRIYDVSGKKVYEMNKVISEGYNFIPLNLKSGVYIFKMKYENKDYEFKGIIRR